MEPDLAFAYSNSSPSRREFKTDDSSSPVISTSEYINELFIFKQTIKNKSNAFDFNQTKNFTIWCINCCTLSSSEEYLVINWIFHFFIKCTQTYDLSLKKRSILVSKFVISVTSKSRLPLNVIPDKTSKIWAPDFSLNEGSVVSE